MNVRQAAFAEAADSGKVWEVVIVRAGLSDNGVFYPDEVLKDAAPRFEGARVYAKPDSEHFKGSGPDVGKLAGWISGVTFVQGASADTGHLAGTLNISGKPELRETISEAWRRGKRDLVGLSIDAVGRRRKVTPARNRMSSVALSIDAVNSVDLVINPAAGGRLIRLVEALPAMSLAEECFIESYGGAVPRRACLADELLDRFFTSPTARSFRECYVQITGDTRITGRLADCNPVSLREALDTSSWAEVFSAAVQRQMIADYRRGDEVRAWRKLVKVGEQIPDFRNQVRVRFGGYGELPVVAEGAAYQALPSPSDEKVSFAATKRGGTESVTLEMLKNDDIGAIRRLPTRLAEAAARTLAHFALDFFRTNPAIYDGVQLFHVSRNNLGSAGLSANALSAARAALMHQTELDSGDPIGTQPAFLAVPLDLEETAINLFRRGANQDKTFVQRMPIEVVPIWYWEDTNDWCVVTDPEVLPCVEIGFLNGEEEPELFVQDLPSVGSMFTNDQVAFKLRHIYGGAVTDFRGVFKSVVA